MNNAQYAERSTKTLEARVKAINLANQQAMDFYEQIVSIFRPLVGQPILKIDGSLLVKYAKLMPVSSNKSGIFYYRNQSRYSLSWSVKTCVMIGNSHGCVYHESTVNIGEISGLELIGINQAPELRTDYTVQEILDKRKAYDDAKKIADNALSALYPFGEIDR